MIQRFEQFREAQNEIKINTILTNEEIEDITLRLVEVLGCSITYYNDTMRMTSKKTYTNLVVLITSKTTDKSEEIFTEIYRIKCRLEAMFPVKGKIIMERWLDEPTHLIVYYGKHIGYEIAYVMKFWIKEE